MNKLWQAKVTFYAARQVKNQLTDEETKRLIHLAQHKILIGNIFHMLLQILELHENDRAWACIYFDVRSYTLYKHFVSDIV
jgi:hypothetical protein